MDRDSVIRRACLIAVPLLAVAAYLLRSTPPRHPPQKTQPIAAASSSANQPAIEPELDPVPQDGPPRGPPSVAAPVPPSPRARPAVDLPPVSSISSAPVHARPRGACGGIEARLITASDDPKWSFATLAVDSKDPGTIRHVGDRVGHWRVARIEWNRVILQAGGHRCAVPLFEGDSQGQSAHHESSASKDGIMLAAAGGSAPRWFVPDSIASGIDQRDETDYVLSSGAVAAIFERAADLLSGLALQTVRRDGSVVGLRFRTIPLDSLLDRLGLQQDDLLLALNDTPATSLDAVRDALDKARSAGSLVAHLERQGQPFELSISERKPPAE